MCCTSDDEPSHSWKVQALHFPTQEEASAAKLLRILNALDTHCREDFLSEWTQRGLVYRGDIAASIKDDCYMCQLHYLRYNLLIFEVDPSRMVRPHFLSPLGTPKCCICYGCMLHAR